MRLQILKLEEAGYLSALRGISLNKEQPVENMYSVARNLAKAKEASHRKFLRQIQCWFYLKLPRHIWTEVDTYKIATVRNSGSTMHNIHKREFVQEDFVRDISSVFLHQLNLLWTEMKHGRLTLPELKDHLPEGYLQDSVLSLNYETIRTILNDRKAHRMPEWRFLCGELLSQINHADLISPQ